MVQRFEIIVGFLILTNVAILSPIMAAESSARVILPAELQRMTSIITFLKTKLASESGYADASPDVRLSALVESLRLFGIAVPDGVTLPVEGSTSELAIALLDGTMPTHRDVMIRDVDVFLRQFPVTSSTPAVEIAADVPRGRAIQRLVAASVPPAPMPVERPAAVAAFFHGEAAPDVSTPTGSPSDGQSDEERRRKVNALLQRVRSPGTAEPTTPMDVVEEPASDGASAVRVAKVKSLLADLRAMVGEPDATAEDLPDKPFPLQPSTPSSSGPPLLVAPGDTGTGATFALPPRRM